MSYWVNGTYNISEGFLSQVGNWTPMLSFDPAISTIQGILLSNNSNITNVNILEYNYTDYFPDLGDICSTAFARNIDTYFNESDFAGNNLFNICITYPNLTREVDSGALNDSEGSLGWNLEYFNIYPGQAKQAANLTNYIVEYMNHTCDQLQCDSGSSGICNSTGLLFPGSNDTQILSNDGVNACGAQICSTLLALFVSNADIGGIGVWISYIIQLAIHLIFAFHIISHFIIHKLFHRKTVDPFPEDDRMILQTKISRKASEPFRDACLDFQKTQAWFMMSLVAAAFIWTKIGTISYTDYVLLLVLSLSGSVLLAFTMIFVIYYEKASWYILFLSTIAYTMCSIFFWLGYNGSIAKVLLTLDPEWAIDLCQNQLFDLSHIRGISKFVANVSDSASALFWLSWAFSLIVMLIAIFLKTQHLIAKSKVAKSVAKRASRTLSFQTMKHKRNRIWWVRKIMLTVTAVTAIPVFIFQVWLLYEFKGVVDAKKNSWGFGQVLAAVVWVPGIVEYIYHRLFTEEEDDERLENHGNPAFLQPVDANVTDKTRYGSLAVEEASQQYGTEGSH